MYLILSNWLFSNSIYSAFFTSRNEKLSTVDRSVQITGRFNGVHVRTIKYNEIIWMTHFHCSYAVKLVTRSLWACKQTTVQTWIRYGYLLNQTRASSIQKSIKLELLKTTIYFPFNISNYCMKKVWTKKCSNKVYPSNECMCAKQSRKQPFSAKKMFIITSKCNFSVFLLL